MRVFFDNEAFKSKGHGGIARLFFEVISKLAGSPQCEVDWFAGAYRTPMPLGSLAGKCRRFYGVRMPPLGPARKAIEPVIGALGRWCLEHSGADVYHHTYYQPFESRRKIARVVTVYDLTHERCPQFFAGDPTVQNRQAALRDASAVVCISASTRDQLLEFYPEVGAKTTVILLASSLQLPSGTPPAAPGEQPYFLYVGNRHPYKNFGVLLEACRLLPGFARDFRLICFGGGPFTAEEERVLAGIGLRSRVDQLSGDDQLLAALYRDAICFIYPSLEEGFGIPLLEAMNCRCAVLASRIPVFEEVAGDAAAYFDPNSAEELAARMRQMLDDPASKQELVRAGTRRAGDFSWDRCAKEHLTLYTSVAGGR
jgi:glycosyltransferase involved in cell wall biosynthesis